MIQAKPETAIRRLRRQIADAIRPRPRMDVDEWVEQRVRLSRDYEAGGGRYQLDDRPWWRVVLRAAGDPTTRHIRLRCCPQLGKTLALIALILYLADNAPASAMVVLPDRDAAIEFRDRLYANAERTGLRTPPESKRNTRHADVGDMRVYLAWPRSKQRLRGRRCKYVFRSEVDVYPEDTTAGDPIAASDQRVKAFSSFLILDESSPIPERSRITKLEESSNQTRWHCLCPKCGTYQVARFFLHKQGELAGRGGFDGYRDEHGNFLPIDQIRQNTHYVCVSGCKITSDQKAEFVLRGTALPSGQTITPKGQIKGTPDRSAEDVGLHLWAIHSTRSFGQIAAEFAKCSADNTLPDFFQNELALSHSPAVSMPTWKDLGKRLAGWHGRGTVPEDAWFLTAGADVQDREVYVVVRAWGDRRTSWLVDWYYFERAEGDDNELVKSDLDRIADHLLRSSWPVHRSDGKIGSNPLGRRELRLSMLGIDANHRTLDVHNWIRSLHGRLQDRVFAVRGEAGIRSEDRYRVTTVYESKRPGDDGKKVQYEGGLTLLNLNPDVFRMDLIGRFNGQPNQAGSWHVTRDAIDSGAFYLRQLVNEPRVAVRGKDGRVAYEWKEIDQSLGHDYWDCEVYASAVAEWLVDNFEAGPGWDASRWPNKREAAGKPAAIAAPPAVARDFE